MKSSTAATSTLDTTETEEPTTTTTTTTTTTSLSRNRESFTDVITRGNVGWVMEKQKNAYELGFQRTKISIQCSFAFSPSYCKKAIENLGFELVNTLIKVLCFNWC